MNISYSQLVAIIACAYNTGLDSDNPSTLELDGIIEDAILFIETSDE